MREVFESAGFSTVSSDVVIQKIAADYANYAEKLSAGADSVLAQLSPTVFRAGIDALHAHAERAGDKPVSEPIDVFVFRYFGNTGNAQLLGTKVNKKQEIFVR